MMLLKGKHIFIIEDNLQNRIVFQVALVRHGASVDFERRGGDAIARLNGSPHIDVILLDLMLADGISGFDLYDELRALPRFAEAIIIAVSAMDPSTAVPKVRAKGFNGFIAKPIDIHELPKQIARILEGERVWYKDEITHS
jgi:CheY-like chemotaxis protein